MIILVKIFLWPSNEVRLVHSCVDYVMLHCESGPWRQRQLNGSGQVTPLKTHNKYKIIKPIFNFPTHTPDKYLSLKLRYCSRKITPARMGTVCSIWRPSLTIAECLLNTWKTEMGSSSCITPLASQLYNILLLLAVHQVHMPEWSPTWV